MTVQERPQVKRHIIFTSCKKPILLPFSDHWYKRNHLNIPLKKDSESPFNYLP